MRLTLVVVFFFFTLMVRAQDDNADFGNLVKLAELYSKNVNVRGKEFQMAIEKLRTPNLDHIIDALIAVGNADKRLLTPEFLSKPGALELKYWYVIRNIHYNSVSTNKQPRPNEEVARETLSMEVDERWLVDNYYYRIMAGVSMLFNEEDLSKYDLNIDSLGLGSEVNKAILFLALSDAMTTRFRVLQVMKKYDRMYEFIKRLPTFNGAPYYAYTDFGFDDFDWVGYDKRESYKAVQLGKLYGALAAHLEAATERGSPAETRAIYAQSIFSRPEYFQYAGPLEKDVKALYKRSERR